MVRLIVGAVGIVLAAMFFFTAHANASTRVVDGNNTKTFFVCEKGDCKKVNALQANKAGENGLDVLACSHQDYECNERTGKCNLKNAR